MEFFILWLISFEWFFSSLSFSNRKINVEKKEIHENLNFNGILTMFRSMLIIETIDNR